MRIVKSFLETSGFFFLTFFLYFLFILNIPIFRDPHGLLAMNDLSDSIRSGRVKELIFASAVVCVWLGTLMMSWVPALNAGMMANLWAVTYLFIWADTVFSLSMQSQSFQFMASVGMGILFIYLFFYALGLLSAPAGAPPLLSGKGADWKMQMVEYWLWGWMCFYLGLSGFLVFNSFRYFGFHIPIAVGAVLVCFLNYLLYLYLQKSQGKDIGRFSKYGRFAFGIWFLGLIVLWVIRRWYD